MITCLQRLWLSCTLVVLSTMNVWCFTPTLTADYTVAGYKMKACYDISSVNVDGICPTEGDLRFRNGYGLYNFSSGNRAANVALGLAKGDLLIAEFKDSQGRGVTINSVSNATRDENISSGDLLAFVATDDSETLSINIGRAGCIIAFAVLEKDESASTASFTISYMLSGGVLKTVSGEGVVGGTAAVETSFFVNGIKYFLADGEPESFVVADGDNAFTVNVRLADTCRYSLLSSLGTELASGSAYEGEAVAVPYPRYQLVDGTLYEAAPTNREFRINAELTGDMTLTVDYNLCEGVNAVFYAEGEDIEGMTPMTTGNIPVRASNAQAAFAKEDVLITKLPAGKYVFHLGLFTSASKPVDNYLSFAIGTDTLMAVYTTGNLCVIDTEEYTLNGDTEFRFLGGSSWSNGQVDYIWIEKTGDVEIVEPEPDSNDVTYYITNAGFDSDLTFGKDGSMKEAVTTSTSLSDRSWAYIAEDSTVYARPKDTSSQSRPDGRKMDAVNGFKGNIQGWTLESNSKFPRCEWTYFGSVPYDLGETAVPISDDGSTYLAVPARPTEFDGGEGFVYLRAGWKNSAIYKQVVNLPCAVYRLEYWTININPNTSSVAKDLTQIVCRKDVFKDEEGTGLQSQVWTKHEFEFTPTAEFTLQFGYEAANAGSGGQPIVALDGIKLYKIGEADPDDINRADIIDLMAQCQELADTASAEGFNCLAAYIGDYGFELEDHLAESGADLEAAVKAGEARMAEIKKAIEEMANVNDILAKMDNLLQTTDYDGKADFEAAYQKILGYKENEPKQGEDVVAELLGAVEEGNAAVKVYVEQNLIASGFYYLYNISAGQYLAAGDNWGTHAVLNSTGLDCELTLQDGYYTIDTRISNGGDSHYLNGVWTDGNAALWQFAKDGNGAFYIMDAEGKYLTAMGTSVEIAEEVSEEALWRFVTPEERLAELGQATESQGVDATFLIKGANFGRNDMRNHIWNLDGFSANLSVGEVSNHVFSFYHSVGIITQVLTDIPAGTYKLTAQGYYGGGTAEELPYFFVNDASRQLPAATGSEATYEFANASAAFSAGLYTIDPITVKVGDDGRLALGVINPENSDIWGMIDNFRLTYYGDVVVEPDPTVTVDNPADMTDRIVNPNFDDASSLGWQGTVPNMVGGGQHAAANVAEHFNKTFDTYQQLSGLPGGVYMLENTGFHRGSFIDYLNHTNYTAFLYATTTDATMQTAMANPWEAKVTVPLSLTGQTDFGTTADEAIYEYDGVAYYSPNDPSAARLFFENGYYNNKVFFAVSDGIARIGVAKNELIANEWVTFDNFKLTYYGGNAEAYQYWIDQMPKRDFSAVYASQQYLDAYEQACSAQVSDKSEAVAAVGTIERAAADVDDNVALWKQLDQTIQTARNYTVDKYSELQSAKNLADYLLSIDEQRKTNPDWSNKELQEMINVINEMIVEVDAEEKSNLHVGDDVTAYLTNPGFENGTNGWAIISRGGGNVVLGGNSANHCFEAWHSTNFDIYQEVSGLPLGVYAISVQGFVRYKDGQEALMVRDEVPENIPIYVYLNESRTQLANWFDYPKPVSFYEEVSGATWLSEDEDHAYPDNMTAASAAFADGGYSKSAYGLVANEGDVLRIGVKGTPQATFWPIFDNFRLTYMGFDVDVVKPVLEEKIAEAQRYEKAVTTKEANEAFTAAYSTALQLVGGTDGAAMFNALTALEKAIAEVQDGSTVCSELHKLLLALYDAATQSTSDLGQQAQEFANNTLSLLLGCQIPANEVDDYTSTAYGYIDALASEPQILLGDANDDGTVSMGDVVYIVNDVLGLTPADFNRENADVNGDGNISMGDAVLVVNMVLGKTDAAGARAKAAVAKPVGQLSLQEQNGRMAISLDNVADYTAFQMDVTLPVGMSISSVALSSRATSSHAVGFNELSDSKVRIVGWSAHNAALKGQSGELLGLILNGNGMNSIVVDNILFTTVEGTEHALDAVSGQTTGISRLTVDGQSQRIYDLNGRRLNKAAKGLSIVNGKKRVTK